MSRWGKASRRLLGAGLVVVAAGLLAVWNIGTLVRLATTPRVAFDLETPPPAPDYADSRNWSALPELDDLADRAPTNAPAVDPRHAGADVFYVHPTTYIGRRWNAPTDDPTLNDTTDRVATGIQASAFNGCCAVYAPPDDLHCVIAWNARGPTYVPTDFELHGTDLRERLCTNPLSWRTDGASASSELNLGAVFLETDEHAPRAAFADARCVNGTLIVSHVGAAPRDLMSRILDHVIGNGNYHPMEYQMFFMNLRQNATMRVSAFASASGELERRAREGDQ